ncbi:hypothetical protein U3A58_03320 [Algoriphagus sp. C2-6-M1]|uniref:hypothetical protein n=1 Tax=Algoriphagus persicinus TaxID=3108754 RepID=UPI002B3C654C|nr:hypothetical protein [Algoriphagus sp. C2-6-M1]MEB2779411.1 hypothetical protein [Algoriphagus sp. C2-6-M1]
MKSIKCYSELAIVVRVNTNGGTVLPVIVSTIWTRHFRFNTLVEWIEMPWRICGFETQEQP